MGPCRDVLGELRESVERSGLTFGASSHRVEHWFFMGHGREFDSDVREPMGLGDFYWPAKPEPPHQDLFSEPTPSQEFLEDWLLRTCEIVDRYRPRLVYFDWWVQHSAVKPYLKKFTAYYYNRAREWGTEVVVTYKHDAFVFGGAVVDIERGLFADAKPYYWQTDTAVAKNSWCHTRGNTYRKAVDIIRDLVDIVSKNGNLLLNVGPRADGTIPEMDAAILREIGDWLRVNGEAIYGSRVWRKSGEDPTAVAEGQFSDSEGRGYTAKDIRFTVKGSYLYATVLDFPANGIVRVESLADRDAARMPHFHGIIKDVRVLGFDEVPRWARTEDALTIMTSSVKSNKPVVFRILID